MQTERYSGTQSHYLTEARNDQLGTSNVLANSTPPRCSIAVSDLGCLTIGHIEDSSVTDARERQRRVEALSLAVRAGQDAAVDTSAAFVKRVRSATTVVFPSAKVIARVERAENAHLAHHQLTMGQYWAAVRAPVARLVTGSGVFEEPTGAVTLWRQISDTGRLLGAQEHGSLLRALHDSGTPHGGLPAANGPKEARVFLQEARPELPAGAFDRLGGELESLAAQVSWTDELRVLHGDPHQDNVIVGPHGPRFIDLELSGVGPAAWDVAVLDVQARRFGLGADWWRAFLHGYEPDAKALPDHQLFARMYEITVVVWAFATCGTDLGLRAEAHRRLASLDDAGETVWRQS
jgi:hypothetical protein